MDGLDKMFAKLVELKLVARKAHHANNFPELPLTPEEQAAAQVTEDVTAGFYRVALAAVIDAVEAGAR